MWSGLRQEARLYCCCLPDSSSAATPACLGTEMRRRRRRAHTGAGGRGGRAPRARSGVKARAVVGVGEDEGMSPPCPRSRARRAATLPRARRGASPRCWSGVGVVLSTCAWLQSQWRCSRVRSMACTQAIRLTRGGPGCGAGRPACTRPGTPAAHSEGMHKPCQHPLSVRGHARVRCARAAAARRGGGRARGGCSPGAGARMGPPHYEGLTAGWPRCVWSHTQAVV